MTILCITTEGISGIRPCTHRGEHRVTCLDHPGYTRNPGTCTGCLPRKADRGFLCWRCFGQVEQAWMRWDRFVELLAQAGARAVVRDSEGRSSSPDGYVPLPGTHLAYDECVSFLRSWVDGQSLEMWVSTPDGARDAIQFARAAETAYRTHEVEERPHRIKRVRCPKCGQLTLVWNPTPLFGGHVTVTCSTEDCGEELDQGSFEQIAEIEENTRRNRA